MYKHLSLLLIFVSLSSFSQVFKVKNGVSISSLSVNQGSAEFDRVELLNDNIVTYSFSLGVDYFEKKWFYLSSEIGYLKKGGREEVEIFDEDRKLEIKESWSYLHFNTTARFPIRLKNDTHIFIGAGPKFDVLIDSDTFKSSLYEGYTINSTVFGAKGELGIMKDFNNIRAGLEFSYLYDFDNVARSEFAELKNDAYQLMLSIGYRF